VDQGLCELRFPHALQIVDLYHAKEHIANLCKLLFGNHDKKVLRYRTQWWRCLEEGNIEKILRQARKYFLRKADLYRKSRLNSTISKKTKKECATPTSVTRAFFVGSGVIEAAVKA